MSFINRLLLTKDYLLGKKVTQSYPVEFCIEPNNLCNLKCKMCPINQMRRKIGYLSMDNFRKIIDEIKDFAEFIFLHGVGEPLLHPEILEMVRYCKYHRLKVEISTNGMLLDSRLSQDLLKAGLDYIIIGIDGASKETYEKVRMGGDYYRVCTNTKEFLKIKDGLKSRNFTVVQMIVNEDTKREIKDFVNIWRKEKGINGIRIKREVDYLFRRTHDRLQSPVDKPCYFLWHTVNIFWDGSVPLCCMAGNLEVCIGNVFEDGGFKKVWNSNIMQRIRELHSQRRWNNIELCRKCDYPQPKYTIITALTFLNEYKVRKIIPYLENILYWNFERRKD